MRFHMAKMLLDLFSYAFLIIEYKTIFEKVKFPFMGIVKPDSVLIFCLRVVVQQKLTNMQHDLCQEKHITKPFYLIFYLKFFY